MVEDETIYMAADSRVSSANAGYSAVYPKIFSREVDGVDLLIGVSGVLRVGQVLRHHMELPRFIQDDEAWLAELVESARVTLESVGIPIVADDSSFVPFEMLVGYCGGLYLVDPSLSIVRDRLNYCAIGSGAMFALGSLYATTASKAPPMERLTLSLDAACQFDPFCAPPYCAAKLEFGSLA